MISLSPLFWLLMATVGYVLLVPIGTFGTIDGEGGGDGGGGGGGGGD